MAASVSGEVTVGVVAVAALLAGAGELVALVLGAEVRGVAALAVVGLATDREAGRVAGEGAGLIREIVADEEEAVEEDEVTDLLVERVAGFEAETDGAGAAVADGAAVLLTDREVGLLGVAVVAGEAAFVTFTAVLLVDRVVTERDAGREGGSAEAAVGGRGEEEVSDLLAGRAVG